MNAAARLSVDWLEQTPFMRPETLLNTNSLLFVIFSPRGGKIICFLRSDSGTRTVASEVIGSPIKNFWDAAESLQVKTIYTIFSIFLYASQEDHKNPNKGGKYTNKQ